MSSARQFQGIRVQGHTEATAVGAHPAVILPLRAAILGQQAHQRPAVGHHAHPLKAAGGGVLRQLLKADGYPLHHLLGGLPYRHSSKVQTVALADPGLIQGIVLQLLVVSSFSSSWFLPSKGPKSVSRSSSITVVSTPGHSS